MTADVDARGESIVRLQGELDTSGEVNQTATTQAAAMEAQCGARAGGRGSANSDLSVEIGGHTDNQGSDESNQNLSARRAKALAQFMVDRGVPTATLNPVGLGEAQPTGDNATVKGRVETRLTTPIPIQILGT